MAVVSLNNGNHRTCGRDHETAVLRMDPVASRQEISGAPTTPKMKNQLSQTSSKVGTPSHSLLKNPFKKLLKPKPIKVTPTLSSDSKKENKKVLFTLLESEVAVYKAFTSNASDTSIHSIIKNKNSSLISQGKFQLYQINSVFNYISCGSLIHPLLQSSKVIKINANTFIIPIKNPIRYWRLTLNSNNEEELGKFEALLESICNFKVDLLKDYVIDSPFNTMIVDDTMLTKSSSVTLKSFVHVDSDEEENLNHFLAENNDRILYQPIPIRPNSNSTSITTQHSVQSSKFNNANNGTFKINKKDHNYDAYSQSSIDHEPLKNDWNMFNFTDLSSKKKNSEDFADSELDLDLNELDLHLDLDLEMEMKNNLDCALLNDVTSDNHDDFDDFLNDFEQFSISLPLSENPLTQRYSLNFKAYDIKKPISIENLDKFKNNFKLVLKNDTTTKK